MDNSAKLRLLYLADILYNRTDDEHTLSTQEIMKILEDEYNLPTHRTTIPEDVKLLNEYAHREVFRFDNISQRNQYKMESRYFDDSELKFLIDATLSAKFISKENSKELVNKLIKLAGDVSAPKFTRNLSVGSRLRASDGRNILNVIDHLNYAINNKKQIKFQYFIYDANKKRIRKNNGEIYTLSPYGLIWDGGFYYVVGYSDKHTAISNFRVDRIVGVPSILEENIHPKDKDFNMDKYTNTMIHMFGGDLRKVSLLCDNSVMDSIIDRFGLDVDTKVYDENKFVANVEIAVTNVFFSWIFGFGGKVSIMGPENVREKYKEMVKSVCDKL